MDSMPRKRKGTKFSPLIGSHLSDGKNHGRRSKKKCSSPEKNGSSDKTAPHSGTFPTDLRLRGLKRKLGCIDPSTRIGRKKSLDLDYAMGREIGNGKFGSVRLCRSRTTGEEFACKTLLKAGEETAHREVEIMQHLSGHPGVVTLKAVFEDSDRVHLVMEFCSGGRLLDRMANEGRCSEHRAANLMKELVSVIKYCHEMGVVHRDIKPENILLTTEGKLKLADFGLAVRVASEIGSSSTNPLSPEEGETEIILPSFKIGTSPTSVDAWLVDVYDKLRTIQHSVIKSAAEGTVPLKEEVARLRKEVDDFKQREGRLRQQVDILKGEKDSLKIERDQLLDDKNTLTAERESLADSLQKSQADLEDTQMRWGESMDKASSEMDTFAAGLTARNSKLADYRARLVAAGEVVTPESSPPSTPLADEAQDPPTDQEQNNVGS